jgi:hypothetical protein
MLTTYRRFKKNTPLRRFATPGLVRAIKRIEAGYLAVSRAMAPIKHQSKYKAICHIGLQKTGTVWFREMLSDPKLYRYSGLNFVDCAGKREGLTIKNGGIYSPIRQISDEILNQTAQPDVATLFVVRNPLAITLSWINSTEKYHITGRGDYGMSERRAALAACDLSGKIDYATAYFQSENRFEKIDRLLELAKTDPSITVVRYEDCTDKPAETFARIFNELDIALPDEDQQSFIQTHSFESYSGRPIDAQANPSDALQGRTHLEIQKLSNPEKERIFSAAGPCLQALYS